MIWFLNRIKEKNRAKEKTALFTLVLTCSTVMSFMPLKGRWFFNKPSFPKIETYSEIQKIFDACDKKTLVTFDIDDTLITARDVMANFDFPLWFGIRAILRYPSFLLGQDAIEPALSILFQQSERFVFDPDIVRIIQQLRNQGSIAIALSLMWSGPYGVIENMPEWRSNMLSKFGINFDGQFPNFTLTSLPKNHGQHPCMHKGILCTNQVDKGEVFGAFLDYNNLKPEHVISFDDQRKPLRSIAKECAKRKITCDCYQMVGAKKLCGQWNIERALLQLDFLMNDKLWLTDSEADAILAGEIKV